MRLVILALLCSAPAFADEPVAKLLKGSRSRAGRVQPVFSPDGDTIAIRVTDGFDLVNLKTGKSITLRDGTGKRILPKGTNRDAGDTMPAFMPDGKTVVTVNHDAKVDIWDAGTGKHLRDLTMPERKSNGGDDLGKHYRALYAIAVPKAKTVLVFGEEAYMLSADDAFDPIPNLTIGYGLCQWSANGDWIGNKDTQASVEYFFGVACRHTPSLSFGESVHPKHYCGTVLPSEDGEMVAVTYWSTVAKENGVLLWKKKGKKREQLKLADATGSFGLPDACGFNGDSSILYCTTGEALAAWDTATGKRLADVALPVKGGSVAFDAQRKRAIVISDDAVYSVPLK